MRLKLRALQEQENSEIAAELLTMTFDPCELLTMTLVLLRNVDKIPEPGAHTFVLTEAVGGSCSIWKLEGTSS